MAIPDALRLGEGLTGVTTTALACTSTQVQVLRRVRPSQRFRCSPATWAGSTQHQ